MSAPTTELVSALRRLVLDVEADVRVRVDDDELDVRQDDIFESWHAQYDQLLKAERTSLSWQAWRDERVTQAAAAWVLLTVFVRYCEDNALVSKRWIGGATNDDRTHALDARRVYFHTHPEHTDREWLEQISTHFAGLPATAGLVDEYSPMHLVAPSGDAARAILEFWWQQDGSGELLYTFDGADTRFLGDVYQDLSEAARKKYALLQTPDFVEEFILDQTMEPAMAEQPLEGFTVIDPTCGSGHFLLGAFYRLHDRWQRDSPALGPRELVAKALDGIYGVDINPFAVAIARFRLTVAALHAAGDTSLEQKLEINPHLAAGDSLLWGANQQTLDDDLWNLGQEVAVDSTENTRALTDILQRQHDVVVGNPPYITVKDPALNATYRHLYSTCHRQYALTVPFMQLFFQLARVSDRERPSGWVGQITSNSFMKREFGSKLVENFFPTVDLVEVIDTSGAYIPGHGTPTVILVGRHQPPRSDIVRAVLGIRGEPGRPAEAAKGLVWTSITNYINEPGYEDTYITVTDLNRTALSAHPWSLAGGGAALLAQRIELGCVALSTQIKAPIGRSIRAGADDAYLRPNASRASLRMPSDQLRPLVLGENVRDWSEHGLGTVYYPYSYGSAELAVRNDPDSLWRWRTTLAARRTFQGDMAAAGLKWWSYMQHTASAYSTPLSITFAFVATHNHFVLDRGGKVFNRSAPVIKLPEGASVDDHLRLLGVLNSSVACFWLKQNSHNKGSTVDTSGARTTLDAWENFYEFTGTTLKDFPLPASLPIEQARVLDSLAQQMANQSPAAVAGRGVPTREALESARAESERIRGLMIAYQEELDWEFYRIYGLIGTDLTSTGGVPGISLGERSFEIALARRMRDDGEQTAWFDRHSSTPITDVPDHLPADYQVLLQARLDAIAENPQIRLLEKPEHKRRWAIDPWDKSVREALRAWLLDRVENRELWFDRDGRPTTISVAQLADRLDRDHDFRTTLRLWAGDENISTTTGLVNLLADEAVPFLAAYRYKKPGLDKRRAWELTWDLQRREDAGDTLDAPIPVPPKYKPTDFVKNSYWAHRGKLDVPKERFISYPHGGRASDPTELLGWAGWDHAEQALALAALITERTDDGASTEQLTPLIAGLAELQPWVRQWHNEIDPEFGESAADTIDHELHTHQTTHNLTAADLAAWTPPATARTRRRKSTQ